MHSVSLEEAAVRTVRYHPDPFVRPLSYRAPILCMSPLYPTLQGQSLYEITGRDRRSERVNCAIGGPWPSSRWAVTLLFMDRPSSDLPAAQRRSLSPNPVCTTKPRVTNGSDTSGSRCGAGARVLPPPSLGAGALPRTGSVSDPGYMSRQIRKFRTYKFDA